MYCSLLFVYVLNDKEWKPSTWLYRLDSKTIGVMVEAANINKAWNNILEMTL